MLYCDWNYQKNPMENRMEDCPGPPKIEHPHGEIHIP